jgi:hypothetical protein
MACAELPLISNKILLFRSFTPKILDPHIRSGENMTPALREIVEQ